MPRRPEASQSVIRALDLLIALRKHGENSIRNLSAKTELTRSTLHRLLLALESRQFVSQDPETERYRLGPRLVDLGHAASQRVSAPMEMLAELRRLALATGETSQLAELSAGQTLFRECVTGAPGLHVSMPRGSHLPPHRSAFGKALLAQLPIDEALILLEGLPNIQEREDILIELGAIRRTGIARDRDVAAPGSFGIASPILDYTSRAVASIGVHAPTSRFDEQGLLRLEQKIKSAAESLSVKLGYFPSSEVWQELSEAGQHSDPEEDELPHLLPPDYQ